MPLVIGMPPGRIEPEGRTDARAAAGAAPIRVTGFPGVAHNLMRYRPADVAAAILEIA